MSTANPSTRAGRGLATYAWFVLGFMVLVVLWGAVVRATGSGAGCGAHWPLCNGDFFPHHPRLATAVEFTHRSMSGICTGLVAALIAWTFVARPSGHSGRKAVLWAGFLLLTEALLGAVLVLGGYVEANASRMRIFMQCIHFSNTMFLLAALAWAAVRLGNRPPTTYLREESHQPVRVAWAALLFTLLSGVTGSVAALADTLFPSPSLRLALAEDFSSTAPLLVRMRWLHPAAAMLSVACVAWLCVRGKSPLTRWLATMLVLQMLLGCADLLLLAPTWIQVLHLLGADLYWIALVSLVANALQPARIRQPLYEAASATAA